MVLIMIPPKSKKMLEQLVEQQEKKHKLVDKENEKSSKEVGFIDKFLKELIHI